MFDRHPQGLDRERLVGLRVLFDMAGVAAMGFGPVHTMIVRWREKG